MGLDDCEKKMRTNLLSEDSVFNLYISKETWDDIKLYRKEYNEVIRERESNRIPFLHRSPQHYCRGTTVDYLKKFSIKKQLTHCTLHLAIYLLDIFMDNHNISAERMPLVANVCLLISAKLEENNVTIPKIQELNAAIKSPYPVHEYKALEILVLKYFHWYIMFPTTAHYTHYFLPAAISKEDFCCSPRSTTFDMQIIIRTYLDKVIDDIHYMQFYKPSMLASAIISLARKSVGLSSWNDQLKTLTNFSDIELEDAKLALITNSPLECKNCTRGNNRKP
ncbi:PREDICTED: cyclin-J [Nicrophorus vespilloides]|uniref:Cyclin-J n=1 Tax=Nicrophorus vespilloides TaxID=110193 RepID=A0ABM1NJR9_NICVS|nr:PREDICTED: cyclin-J [Nicrophorus vespilloides]